MKRSVLIRASRWAAKQPFYDSMNFQMLQMQDIGNFGWLRKILSTNDFSPYYQEALKFVGYCVPGIARGHQVQRRRGYGFALGCIVQQSQALVGECLRR